MTDLAAQTPRGMHDVVGEVFHHKAFLLKTFYKTARLYGFEGAETPVVEERALFERSAALSDIVMKEMFELKARGEDEAKRYVLRPEGTAPLMRCVLQSGLTQKLPLRFCYDGPMFRYDRPQKGRLRQFHQVGVELLGSASFLMDVEVIQQAAAFLEALALTDTPVLKLNSLGDSESRNAFREALLAYLTPHKDALSADSQVRLSKNPLRILDSKQREDRALLKDAPKLSDFLTRDAGQFFENVCKTLESLGIAFEVEASLVRGLDYYTQTAFEFKAASLGAQDTVLGGGRFDGLSQTLGGPAIPGVGWAAGCERLMLLMKKQSTPSVRVAFLPLAETDIPEALQRVHVLRQDGVPTLCLSEPVALAKRLKKAHQRGVRYALIMGEDERTSQCVQIKDLDAGTQEKKSFSNLASFLKGCLCER